MPRERDRAIREVQSRVERSYGVDGRRLTRNPLIVEVVAYLIDTGWTPFEIGTTLEVAVSEYKSWGDSRTWAWDRLSPAERQTLTSRLSRLLSDLRLALLRSELPINWAVGSLELADLHAEHNLMAMMIADDGAALASLASQVASWHDAFLIGSGKHDEFRMRRALVILVAECLGVENVRRWAWATTRIVNVLVTDQAPISERAVRRIWQERSSR